MQLEELYLPKRVPDLENYLKKTQISQNTDFCLKKHDFLGKIIFSPCQGVHFWGGPGLLSGGLYLPIGIPDLENDTKQQTCNKN